jgi:hypothetical protein
VLSLHILMVNDYINLIMSFVHIMNLLRHCFKSITYRWLVNNNHLD